MNLQIRSQDRSALVPYEGLYICKFYGKYMISNYLIDCPNDLIKIPFNFINLGTYKTKERALEILDEIQERIINLQLVNLEEKGKARSDVYNKEYLRCVYEMPEN